MAGAAALLLSLCAAALFLRGTLGGDSLVVSRRSMALLAHAILLVVLRDAGVLSAPAARRRNKRHDHDQQQLELVQAPRAASLLPPSPKVVAARCAASPLPGPARAEADEPTTATKEIVLVEKWAPTGGDDDHIARRHRVHRPAVAVQVAVAADADADADDRAALLCRPTTTRSRGEEESVDETNRRFDKFIADMRRNMQLETLQMQLLKPLRAEKEIVPPPAPW